MLRVLTKATGYVAVKDYEVVDARLKYVQQDVALVVVKAKA